MKQIIKPINEFILLEVLDKSEDTEYGITFTNEEKDRTEAKAIRAKVINVPTKKGIEVKKGDIIFASKWEGHHAYLGADHYLLIKHEHILGVIDKQ